MTDERCDMPRPKGEHPTRTDYAELVEYAGAEAKRRADAEDAAAHACEAREKLRAQVLRTLAPYPGMLRDAAHALRRPAPRVNVGIDHAERCADAMDRLMRSLRG